MIKESSLCSPEAAKKYQKLACVRRMALPFLRKVNDLVVVKIYNTKN